MSEAAVHQHRLLILGSMDEFVDLVKIARERGIYTVVVDGYSDGPAKKYADKSFNIDVRRTQEIADLCKRENVDGIIASFSDLLAECLVDIADKAGLPCYAKPEPFTQLREKPLMKQMFFELGIPTPKTVSVYRDTLAADIKKVGLPCVVKPVNGYGSRGVYVFDSVEDIQSHFDEITSYSSFDYILAEEYNDGFECNMMNWIVDGEPIVISIADREKSTEIPHAIPHVSRITYPSRLTERVYEEAQEIVRKIARRVGIENGPLCMQFFYSSEKGIQVCEAAGRIFGYEHELVSLVSGISIEDLLLDCAYDAKAVATRLKGHTPFFTKLSAGLYFHGYEGTIATIEGVDEFLDNPHVVEILEYYNQGDRIVHGVGAKPYVMRFYITADDREMLDELTYKLYSSVHVKDADGNELLYLNQMMNYQD